MVCLQPSVLRACRFLALVLVLVLFLGLMVLPSFAAGSVTAAAETIEPAESAGPGTNTDTGKAAESDGVSHGQDSGNTLSVTTKPRWEFGVGAASVSGYDYPASRDVNERTVALPFFIYRSPVFRFGGGGVRAVALERPRVRLDFSVGGSLNASAEGEGSRVGMPDLDFLFELGPQLEVQLFEHRLASDAYWLGRFSSELRAVFSTDFGSVDSRGYVLEAGFGASLRNLRQSTVDLFTSLDITYASERLQDYFYEVGPEFVTADRPLYNARAGYLESSLFLGIAYRAAPTVRLVAGVGKGFFANAANERSPLFETTEQTRYALGIVWTIKTSKSVISVVDMGESQ